MSITNETLSTFLVKNKMDFDVQMMPQHFTTPEGIEVNAGFCPVRTDSWEPLGNGGKSVRFKPIQNRVAFNVIPEMAKIQNMDLVEGKVWGNGAGTFASVSLGDMTIGGANDGDIVSKHLTVVNSHDGSRALTVLITPYRVLCQNQITAALKKAGDNKFSIRHNSSADTRIDEMINNLRIINGEFERTEDLYNQLHGAKVSKEHLDVVFNRMFPKPVPDAGSRAKTIWKNSKEAVERRFAVEAERTKSSSAWAMYNAIQGTIQHDSRNTAGKSHSVLVGSIATRSKKTLEQVLEVI